MNETIASPHAHAVVDLDAVAHNTALFTAATKAAVMAVVKADGFGHGAVWVARAALSSGATWLGVTTCAEALHLRASGITAPILSWMHSPLEDFGPALLANVDISVSSREHLSAVADCAARLGVTADVHLKADTGLHRNGARPEEWPGLVRLARDLEIARHVRVRGVWSHLVAEGMTRLQVKLFDEAVAVARGAGLRPEIRHLANSAAALGAPQTHYELVRPGIGLYGVEPDPRHIFGLQGAMTLRARLILVKRVPAGSGVSYEHDYVTDRETTLALVPLGYADGLPWAAARHAEVSIGGRRFPVAGRIAMDQFVVDVGDAGVRIGDEAVVFGPGTGGEPTVADWARWANTVPHEIITGIGPRVARRYVHACARRAEEPEESLRV
ncbi:alanine racemase [Kibdelosporangium banguiense]|uniref:Alanine racemase n=1 Tax=Kibdelosporangium banguiense TaxID=1365924 RepID=A0ABS4TK59_9PSEU|nr:alanine racemase [Kibdelosporangium banguiense]MBP2324802.1 alanine racemase [Kibdelosporangium banguiense]